MLDTRLRPLKDKVFDPVCRLVPQSVTPINLTFAGFLAGCAATSFASFNYIGLSLLFWFLNRILDNLDGGVARLRGQESDLGGFLDLLSDFWVYSTIPINCASSRAAKDADTWGTLWWNVSTLEMMFHINNFVLFYVAAVVEKQRGKLAVMEASGEGKEEKKAVKELTSVAMKPALVEGVESAFLLTVMLARPQWTEWVCITMTVLVLVGIVQRVRWLNSALGSA